MRFTKFVGLIVILLVDSAAWGQDLKPLAELSRLKNSLEAAQEKAGQNLKKELSEAQKTEIYEELEHQRSYFSRCALALAEAYPNASEAPQALAWAWSNTDGKATLPVKIAIYDLIAKRYLDDEAILPVVRIAWWNPIETSHAETFLRAALEKSSNVKIRSLACFSLGRHQQQLSLLVRMLEDPVRSKILIDRYGKETVEHLRSLKPGNLNAQAEILFDRTIKEFGDLQPLGSNFPPLGEQAAGELFQLKNLEIGQTVPEIASQDIDGRTMKLSEFRGKVVVLAFWATWCGPCMAQVPHEKALVERMKGRPFVMLGVNGDDDRAKAKEVSANEGINWRSFWDGGRGQGTTPIKWGISSWPTVYLIDAKGVIRKNDLRAQDLETAVEALVIEAETAKKP